MGPRSSSRSTDGSESSARTTRHVRTHHRQLLLLPDLTLVSLSSLLQPEAEAQEATPMEDETPAAQEASAAAPSNGPTTDGGAGRSLGCLVA